MKERKPLPLDPPATSAELDHAAAIWTTAQDVMVARGFARRLWGTFPAAQHEFVVLMLRAEQARPCHPGAPLISAPNAPVTDAEPSTPANTRAQSPRSV